MTFWCPRTRSILKNRTWNIELKSRPVNSQIPKLVQVGYLKLVTICKIWWLKFDVGDIFSMLVPDAKVKIVDASDQNGQTSHQHLRIATNTFCLQHLSPTYMLPYHPLKKPQWLFLKVTPMLVTDVEDQMCWWPI